jgi:hypothetical protein
MISCSCSSCSSSSSSSRAYTSVYRVHDQAYTRDSSIRPTPRRRRDIKSRKLTLRRLQNVNKKLSGKINPKKNPRASSSLQANLACKGRSYFICFPAASTTTPTTTTTTIGNVQLSIKLRVVASPGVHKECVPRINTKPKLLVARMPPADDVLWRRQSRRKENHERRRAREREEMSAPFLPSYLRTYLPTGPTYVPSCLKDLGHPSDGGWTGKRFFHSGSSSLPNNKPWS